MLIFASVLGDPVCHGGMLCFEALNGFFHGNVHTESRSLVLLYYYTKRKLMLCFNKVGTDVCSTSVYVCRPLLSCAVTQLAHERTHLPYCMADRHFQPVHKKRQDVGLG
jgi:hypothetical protein